MKRTIPLLLHRSDIVKVGHTNFESEGMTTILCDLETANIEEIILRSILADMGYNIIACVDFFPEDESQEPAIAFMTDLPWHEYEKLSEGK